jgi:hypothetical protein
MSFNTAEKKSGLVVGWQHKAESCHLIIVEGLQRRLGSLCWSPRSLDDTLEQEQPEVTQTLKGQKARVGLGV